MGQYTLTDDSVEQTTQEGGDPDREREWRYLRAASHDLRGPVANVRAYASMLQDPRMELPPRARRAVEVIARNADRALELLREFFDAEQAERGRLELPVEPVPLAPGLDSAVASVAAVADARRIRIDREDQDATVLAEAGALRHVLGVALEHAVCCASEGSVVTIVVTQDAGTATIRVGYRGSAGRGDAITDRKTAAVRDRKLGLGFRLAVAACEAEAMGGTLALRPGEHHGALELSLRLAPVCM